MTDDVQAPAPAAAEAAPKTKLAIRLDAEEMAALERLAEAAGKSPSRLARGFVARGLKRAQKKAAEG